MKRLLIFTALLYISPEASAQLSFIRTYGAGNGQCIQQTSDSGYVISGVKDSGSVSYTFLLKTDPSGQRQWMTLFTSGFFPITTVLVFPNGYFTSAADYATNSSELIWTDLNGNVVRSVTIDGQVHSSAISGDGLIACAGRFNDDLMVCKVDMQDTLPWSHYWDFGNSWIETGKSVFEAEGGALIIAAEFTDPLTSTTIPYFIKLNSTGVMIRHSVLSCLTLSCSFRLMGTVRMGSNYLFYGKANRGSGPDEMLAVQTDTAFNLLTHQLVHSVYYSIAGAATSMMNGGATVLRETQATNDRYNSILILDSGMNIVSERTIRVPVDLSFGLRNAGIIQTLDSGFAYTGQSYPNASSTRMITLTRLDADAQITCGDSISIPVPDTLSLSSTNYTNPAPGGSLATQSSGIAPTFVTPSSSIWCMNNPTGVSEPQHNDVSALLIYPVPATVELKVQSDLQGAQVYFIISPTGATVLSGVIESGQSILIADLAPGIYLFLTDTGASNKFTKQ